MQCPDCGKTFASKYTMKRHRDKIHSENITMHDSQNTSNGDNMSATSVSSRSSKKRRQSKDFVHSDNITMHDSQNTSIADNISETSVSSSSSSKKHRLSTDHLYNSGNQPNSDIVSNFSFTSTTGDKSDDSKQSWRRKSSKGTSSNIIVEKLNMSDMETRAWQVMLQLADLKKLTECDKVEDLWDNEEWFKYVHLKLQRLFWTLENGMKNLHNGVIYPKILTEITRLEKHGYTKKEAHLSAWKNRSYLIQKVLKNNKQEIENWYFYEHSTDTDQ